MAERKPVEQYHVLGGTREDAEKFAEHDFLIRSGMCPNGCGLMLEGDDGQHCQKCDFMCNTLPDPQASN